MRGCDKSLSGPVDVHHYRASQKGQVHITEMGVGVQPAEGQAEVISLYFKDQDSREESTVPANDAMRKTSSSKIVPQTCAVNTNLFKALFPKWCE